MNLLASCLLKRLFVSYLKRELVRLLASYLAVTCVPGFQVYRGGVSGGAGRGLLHLGLLAEPHGSGHHDRLLPHHRLPQTALHQEIHIGLGRRRRHCKRSV